LGGQFDNWDCLPVFTNKRGKLGIVIEHHVQDHLLVGWIVGVPIRLPEPSVGIEFDNAIKLLVAETQPSFQKIWTSSRIEPTRKLDSQLFAGCGLKLCGNR
jgi:hypothetical protein